MHGQSPYHNNINPFSDPRYYGFQVLSSEKGPASPGASLDSQSSLLNQIEKLNERLDFLVQNLINNTKNTEDADIFSLLFT